MTYYEDAPNIMKRLEISSIIIMFLLLFMTAGCGHAGQEWNIMDHAESLMQEMPDSALDVLEGIDVARLTGKEEKARYALLRSMALDKNYVDTTTFDILQPAIDYYFENGTPDEILKTRYYQGRIYQNKQERDSALRVFARGMRVAPQCADSAIIARTLVAQACIYYDLYDFVNFIRANQKAATIYHTLSDKDHEFDCLIYILDAASLLKDKAKADSVNSVLDTFGSLDESEAWKLAASRLSYIRRFGSVQEIRNVSDSISGCDGLDSDVMLSLADAYNTIGENGKAQRLLDSVAAGESEYDTLKFLATSVYVHRDSGNFKDAFSLYWNFNLKTDSINSITLNTTAKSIADNHRMEIEALEELRSKSEIIWFCTGGIIILLMAVAFLAALARGNRIKKELALQKVRTAEAENESLKIEQRNLALENRNLQLERDKKNLVADNLQQRINALESESSRLKELLESSQSISDNIKENIRMRLNMLNSILATRITSNEKYEKAYEEWVKKLTADTESFMNSNRLAFTASHPLFIRHLEEHGLNESEISYVCLYALGLTGREIGIYMKRPSHVNLSTLIRKKLGLDSHDTNIGIYIRNLINTP